MLTGTFVDARVSLAHAPTFEAASSRTARPRSPKNSRNLQFECRLHVGTTDAPSKQPRSTPRAHASIAGRRVSRDVGVRTNVDSRYATALVGQRADVREEVVMDIDLVEVGPGVSVEVCAHLERALPSALVAFESEIRAVSVRLVCLGHTLFAHVAIDVGDGRPLHIDDDDPSGRALVGRITSRAVDALAVRLDPRSSRLSSDRAASGFFRVERETLPPPTWKTRRVS
jgi:hypothetical protein